MRIAVLGLVLLTTAGKFASAAETAPRPNVVFILADDLGWTDLGCQGSGYYKTPHIDHLASGGMRFTNGYSCGPNCQPTRAALLSGQYAPRTGVYTVGGINRFPWQSQPLRPVDNVAKLSPAVETIAESLQRAGYVTGLFGKWHLGEDPQHHPSMQGFDEALVSMGRHFEFTTNPATEYAERTYLADFLTDRVNDFLERHRDELFFLYVPHFGVHSPFEAKEELIAQFAGTPGSAGHDNPTYAAMIASVDESVGRIVAKLDELGLRDNTLVIFSSDNGGVGGYESIGLAGKNGVTNNAPLRGGKGTLYEGGIRVPYIFNWPGKIEAGAVSARQINSVDMYPTLLELTTGDPPQQPLDGVSYLSSLTGVADADRGPIFWHFPGYLGAANNQWRTRPCGVIRDGDWKLIEFFEDGRLELYHLRDDLGEEHNLAAVERERAKEMHQALLAWRESINAQMPTANNNQQAPNGVRKKSGAKQRQQRRQKASDGAS